MSVSVIQTLEVCAAQTYSRPRTCTFQLVRPSCCGVGDKFGLGLGLATNVGYFLLQPLQNSFIIASGQ